MTTTYPKIEMVLDTTTLTFEKEEVISATVIEETDPVSRTIPIGKLDFRVLSYDDDFSMFSGSYLDLLADRPLITAYEVVDSVERLLGKFYLDDWENISENEYSFEAMDIMGVLDKTVYEGVFFSTLTTVEDILEDVLGDLDISYTLDSYIGAKTLKGWIPPGTYRTAIQQICFAAGAVARTARETELTIEREVISDYYAIFADAAADSMIFPSWSPGGSDFTIEKLFRLKTGSDAWARIFCCEDWDDGNPGYAMITDDDWNQLLFEVEDDSGNRVGNAYSDGDVSDYDWHHVAILVDRNDAEEFSVELDGVALNGGVGIDISSLIDDITLAGNSIIAKDPDSETASAIMDVAYSRIWSDLRTSAELAENRYRRTPLDETNLERNFTYRELDETDFAQGEDGTFAGTITFGRTPGEYVLPAYDSEVLDSEKTNKNPVKLKTLVTSIELVSHLYTQSTELLDIYEEDLEEGTHKIVFDQPFYGIIIAGPGYIEASLVLEDDLTLLVTEDEAYEIEVGGAYVFGSNSVTLDVSAPGGTVTITGYPYVDSQRAFTFLESGVLDTTDLNALEIPKATLVSPENVEEILDLLRDYYQIRYEQEMTLFPTTIKTNDVIQTSTLFSKELVGPVEKMELDLTRGYLAKTRIVGREV